MQYSILIDLKFIELHDIDIKCGLVYAYLLKTPNWAKRADIDGDSYYFVSRTVICKELPAVTDKPDTAYRLIKKLCAKGLLKWQKMGSKDMIHVVPQYAKEYGREKQDSENNPSKLGNISENSSDENPTYQRTIYNIKEQEIKKSAKRPIVLPYESENFITHWNYWKEYKKKEHRFNFKSEISEQAALNKLAALGSSEQECINIILQSIQNGWKGLFKIKNDRNGKKHGADITGPEIAEGLDEYFADRGL